MKKKKTGGNDIGTRRRCAHGEKERK